MSQRGTSTCSECGSHNVSQIRTQKHDVEIPVNGARITFSRLYLERCDDCKHITLYGKTCLGSFSKTYLPTVPAAALAQA